MKLWLRADNGVATTGTAVNTWSDRSGNNNNAVFQAGQPTTRPSLVAGSANGYPTIDFDGANDQLMVPHHASLNMSQWDVFLVGAVDGAKNNNAWYSKGSGNATPNYGMWSASDGSMHLPIRGPFSLSGAVTPSGVMTSSFRLAQYSYSTLFFGFLFPSRRVYSQGSMVYTDAAVFQWPQTNGQPLRIGSVSGQAGWFLDGDIAEMIVFSDAVNTAQRVIVGNYLAAKYGFTLTSNDLYGMDNPGNGDFDHDVAGIGRMNGSNAQTDSRGTGIVRINNATDLNDYEFLLWGHNNQPMGTWNSTDHPPTMEGRWHRVWRVSEVNATSSPVDVGAVDIAFDLTGFSPITTSHIRLLVDTDNDGIFADETPIGPPTALGGNQYRFAGVTALTNARRFTLGTIDYDQTPLPVELVRFTAEAEGAEGVRLEWATASEKDNDHFTVERSADLVEWTEVVRVAGAGTSFTPREYAERDFAPLNGRSYYRLKQTDTDGSATWSEVVPVLMELPLEATIFPVPFSEGFQVLAAQAEVGDLQLFDAQGRLVRVPITRSAGRLDVDAASLVPGTYVLRLDTPAGRVTRTLVKL